MALMAKADGSRKYVGAAVIGLNRAMKERLYERVAGCPAGRAKEFRSRSRTRSGSSPAWSATSAS
ncbi:MAG: hypothetical protein E5X64_39755 [Mesorhizobium sp.]|nr:MAG: hypothetical protein E5X64_39755 [Mesorhizobium sp.]